jgi:hypothetical protein
MTLARIFVLIFLTLSLPAAFGQPVDDTSGIVNLDPDSTRVLACTQVSLTLHISVTDARVFDLHMLIDPARLQLLSLTNGPEPTMHIMPPLLSGSNLTVDGFFEPNLTGTTLVATITFYVNPTVGDDTTTVYFDYGQGYSGTAESPVPILFTGDSAVIYIEGTPPLPPSNLLLIRQPYPTQAVSIEAVWNPVYYDMDGDTLINPLYVIYREHPVSAPGILDSIGATADTFFWDFSIATNPDPVSVQNTSTLQVHTRKTQP